MAITSILELRLKPDSLDSAKDQLSAILADTRKFPGCLGVEVLVDVKDPAHVTAVEQWESLDADDTYRAWRASPDGASNLGDLLAGAPVLTRYETSSI